MKKTSLYTSLWVKLRGYVLITFFCVLSLGQLQRIEIGVLPAFYLHEILLLGYVLVHFMWPGWRRFCWNSVQRLPTLAKVWLSWVGVGLLAAFFAHTLSAMPLLYLARIAFYTLGLAALFFDIENGVFTSRQLWTALLCFIGLIMYFGLMQYTFLPDLRFLFFLGWDDHYYRLASTLFDPGFTGLVLVLSYSILQSLLVVPARLYLRWNKHVLILLSVLAVTAVALTYSRASYLALGVVLIGNAFVLWHRRRQLALGSLMILFIFVASLRYLPQPGGEGVNLARTSTIVARTSSASLELSQLDTLPNLVLGQGLFVQETLTTSLYSETLSHAKQPDSWLVLILTGTGVVGTLLFLVLLVQCGVVISKTDPLLSTGILAILVHGLFNASLTYPFVILLYGAWVIAIRASHVAKKISPRQT